MQLIKKTMSDKVFDIVNLFMILFIGATVIYPLYFTVIASFSDPYEVARGNVVFWVRKFTTEPYKNVFINDDIWIGYRNSIINTILIVVYHLAITIPAAFVMARKKLKGRKILMGYFIFTMYFGGGLIPYYILIRDLGLINLRWALIIPSGFGIFHMIIVRTFYQTTIPDELFEAAKIDGCREPGIFFRIVLPLSGAVIAVIALFTAVGAWNSWFDALLFITNRKLYPLQYVLRSILIQNQQMNIINTDSMNALAIQSLMKRKYMAEGMKYSLIFVSSLPMLIAYPFVQKHFVKGVMIGSIKG